MFQVLIECRPQTHSQGVGMGGFIMTADWPFNRHLQLKLEPTKSNYSSTYLNVHFKHSLFHKTESLPWHQISVLWQTLGSHTRIAMQSCFVFFNFTLTQKPMKKRLQMATARFLTLPPHTHQLSRGCTPYVKILTGEPFSLRAAEASRGLTTP